MSADAPNRNLQPAAAPEGVTFPKAARLLKHADFDRVYKQGRRHFSSHMTVFYLPQTEGKAEGKTARKTEGKIDAATAGKTLGTARTGFTVGRVLGGAVQRNRIKRRMRDAVRQRRSILTGPVDIVINPKKSVLKAEFPILLEEVTRAFELIARKLAEK